MIFVHRIAGEYMLNVVRIEYQELYEPVYRSEVTNEWNL